jgi:regulator of nucleoside diphosphate kinase
MSDRIFVTKSDLGKLRGLLETRHAGYSYDRPYLDKLEEELDRAEIVESYDVAHDVITMNSEVQLRDLDSGEVSVYRLVFPSQARSGNDVSVLAPIGTAMLGYRAGDVVASS